MVTHSRLESLGRLRALIDEALTLADSLTMHQTGIALDTARLSVETALAAEPEMPGHAGLGTVATRSADRAPERE